VLAGRPGDRLEAYQRAGVDDFVYLGCDAVAVLDATLAAALDAGGES
jgi:methylmalonyl-CoA mutase